EHRVNLPERLLVVACPKRRKHLLGIRRGRTVGVELRVERPEMAEVDRGVVLLDPGDQLVIFLLLGILLRRLRGGVSGGGAQRQDQQCGAGFLEPYADGTFLAVYVAWLCPAPLGTLPCRYLCCSFRAMQMPLGSRL